MRWKHEKTAAESNRAKGRFGRVTRVAQRANSAFIGKWSALIVDYRTFNHVRLGMFNNREEAMVAVEAHFTNKKGPTPCDIVVKTDPQGTFIPSKHDPRPEAIAAANAERKKGGKH